MAQPLTLKVDGVDYTVDSEDTPEVMAQKIAAQKGGQSAAPAPQIGPQQPPQMGTLGFQGPKPNQKVGVSLPPVHESDARKIFSTMLDSMGLAGTAMAPEFGIPLQMLTGGASGALNGNLTSSETGLPGALRGVIENGILNLHGISKGLPDSFNRGAYRLGGFKSEAAKDAASALETVNEGKGGPLQPFNRRIPVGAEARTNKEVERLGENVGATRKADPNMHDLQSILSGSTNDIADQTINTRLPVSERSAISTAEQDMIDQHTAARRRPALVAAPMGQPVYKGTYVPDLTTKELADLEVGLKHSNDAKNFGKAQSSGNVVSPEDYRSGRVDKTVGDKLRDARYTAESQPFTPDEVAGPMQLADEKFAAGKTVQGNNAILRNPEGFSSPNVMASRGGLGAGVGRTLGFGAGALIGAGSGGLGGGAIGGLLGSAAGPIVFSPRNLSSLGYTIDDILRMLAPVGESTRVIDDLNDANPRDRADEAARVQRRKPK